VRPRTVLIAICLPAAFACGGEPSGPLAPDGGTTTSTAPASTTTAPAPTTTATTADQELSGESRLRPDGIGPINVGMTPAEATSALGREVAVDPNEVLNDLCGYAKPTGGPDNLGFMVLREDMQSDWVIHRVDVYEGSPIATTEGIRIGSTEAQVKQVYGDQVKVEEHPYTGPEGHYLIVDTDGDGTGFKRIFETDGAKVTTFRSGHDEPVSYIEGCA
jgi:hypothetical protein